MTDHPEPKRPILTDAARQQLQARRDREAAALRANLRRRKDQARSREREDAAGEGIPIPPNSGQ